MEGQWNANDRELAEIKFIAEGDVDTPVLLININQYNNGEYSDGKAYQDYMKILPQILDEVGGKLLWQLPTLGQPLGYRAAYEILGNCYPYHKSLLALPNVPSSVENYRLKNFCVSEAVIHRCPTDIIQAN